MHACIYIHAHLRGASVRARVCVCDSAPTHPRPHVQASAVGVDRRWLGSQAFSEAMTFNANIGAWNTAAVSDLGAVCAAFSATGGAPARRDALGGSSVRRGPLCARARVCADVWARACAV